MTEAAASGLRAGTIGYVRRMTFPVYVLLPEGVEWTAVPGSTAQSSAPVRWYLRQQVPDAATQTAVLVGGDGADLERCVVEVVRRAGQLGGIAIDAGTQEPIDLAARAVRS